MASTPTPNAAGRRQPPYQSFATPLRQSTNTRNTQSPSSNTEDSQAAEIARLKRQNAALLADKQNSQSSQVAGRKRKRDEDTVARLGRGFRRLIALFHDVAIVILEGEAYEMVLQAKEAARQEREANGEEEEEDELFGDGLSPEEEEAQQLEQREKERLYQAFVELLRLIPNLRQKLVEYEPGELSLFLRQLQKGANDARSEDIKRVADYTGTWLNDAHTKRGTPPTPLFNRGRENRGLQHDVAGLYLCSIGDDWDDQDVRVRMRNGTIPLSFYARAFYPRGMGDINRVEQGFLRSQLLIEVCKILFTSPSSANGNIDVDENEPPRRKTSTRSSKSTRGPVAQILNMNGKITPRCIAYIAVLLHFTLTDASQWCSRYLGLDYRSLYDFIIDFFEDVKTPAAKRRVDDLLAFWNRHVFPNAPSTTAGDPDVASSRRRLAEQREALEAEAEEQAEQEAAARA